jgi:hypothetical protein
MRDSLALVPLDASGVVHAISTPFQSDAALETSTTTNPLTYSEITSSTAAPLTGYTGRYTQPDPRAAWGTSFYSPTVAGLTTEEPTDLVFDGEPLFAYVGNNPIGRLDPDGLRWFSKSEPAWHDKCRGASPLSPGNPKACQYGDLSFNLGFQTWDLSCVCTTMPDDPGANCARGCIQCARDQGADVTRAHPHLWCKKKCRKDGLWTFRNDQQFSDAVNRTCTRCWFQYPLTR